MGTAGKQATIYENLDPLAYLRRTSIVEYAEKQAVYEEDKPTKRLYLVANGKVRVSTYSDDGKERMIDLYGPDEFFGVSSFCEAIRCPEHAIAHENSKLMSWHFDEIKNQMKEEPLLAVAMLQLMSKRVLEYQDRIQYHADLQVPQRVAGAVLHFSQKFGEQEENGSTRMMPMTQALLATYSGTSREIVTANMNRLARLGLLRYDRKKMIVYVQSLKEWVENYKDPRGAQTMAAGEGVI